MQLEKRLMWHNPFQMFTSFSPRQSLAQVLNPSTYPDTGVFLGGDPMNAKRLAKKSKAPLIGYGEHSFRGFDAFFQKSRESDLMLSGLCPQDSTSREGIALLPGSRPEHLLVALPLMIKILDDTASATVLLSPFTNQQTIDDLKSTHPNLRFKQMTHPNDLAHFKTAITIPGTNTMQLAVLGVPFLMIFPTHDHVFKNGWFAWTFALAFLGGLLKRFILRVAVSKSVSALPNQYFNYMFAPNWYDLP